MQLSSVSPKWPIVSSELLNAACLLSRWYFLCAVDMLLAIFVFVASNVT